MTSDIIGAVIAATAGVGIAVINYLISKAVIAKKPEKFSAVTVVRQLVQIGFLVAVFFVGRKTDCNIIYLLVGAVLGMTLPMVVLTKKLLSFNESLYGKKEKVKEEETDG